MIFVLFCFNVWYQESKDIWDIRVLIRTGKIIIFVELLDGWLSSKFGLALIFEIKNSLVKKFVVLYRNLQILFYLSVSRCLHTMYCDWRGNQANKLLRCYHPFQDIFLFTGLDMSQASVFLQRRNIIFVFFVRWGKFQISYFFFWKWENSKKISNHCIILNKGIDISSQKTFLCTLPQASVNNSVNELNVLCVYIQLRGNQELIQLWVHYVLYLQRIKLYSLHDYFMEWVSGVFIHAAPDARAITQWSSPARVLRLAKFEESTWKGWPSSHRT